MIRFSASAIALSFTTFLVACASTASPPSTETAESTAPAYVNAINPTRMSEDVRILASDAFMGRAPGTKGEEITIAWLSKQFAAIGLEPGGENGGWTQRVPLTHTWLQQPGKIQLGGQTMTLGNDAYLSTVRPVDRATIANAPVVFVGYGVNAPERQWDDFKGVDLKGKVALFLINDPDFEAAAGEPVSGVFGGKAMTYYGRWTYKFEEAARRGAIAALIVHDTAGVGYGWDTIKAPQGENYDIVRDAGATQPVLLQGWVQADKATALFAESGLDLAALKQEARTREFQPRPLKSTFTADLSVRHEQVISHNVLGKISGTKRPDETVMLSGHWDAYGIGAPDQNGQTVRAGANDDALGMAGVMEIARAFKAGPKPDRTVVFAAWTAEERGLLGSEYYANHPLYNPAKMAANLTLDVLQTAGPSHDVILIGAGQNELERDLARFAAAEGRVVTPDAQPQRGLFYRADHFPLAKRGVPVLLIMGLGGGADLVEGGRAAGDQWVADYMKCYHQPCDRWSADWDLRGAAADTGLVWQIARELAFSNRWPNWYDASEFKGVRDKSASERR